MLVHQLCHESRTSDLWCWKWPLYQLSHNHSPFKSFQIFWTANFFAQYSFQLFSPFQICEFRSNKRRKVKNMFYKYLELIFYRWLHKFPQIDPGPDPINEFKVKIYDLKFDRLGARSDYAANLLRPVTDSCVANNWNIFKCKQSLKLSDWFIQIFLTNQSNNSTLKFCIRDWLLG